MSSQGIHSALSVRLNQEATAAAPSHRHPSNVASPTKYPIVVVAIKVHDIEPLK